MDLKILQDTPPWEWPSDAGETFRKVFTNRRANPSDRLVAVELAGDLVVMNDDLANALLALVRDAAEPEQLRGRAAISFGPVLEHTDHDGFDDPLDDPPITEETFLNLKSALHHLYLDPGTPKQVRRRALEASVRSHEDWHKDAIRTAYSS